MITAVLTIVANNYAAHARVLAQSLEAHHPGLGLHIINADDIAALSTLGIPRLEHFLFRYDREQVITSVKPYAIRHLLERGFERVLFLDADILVLGDLTPVLAPEGDPAIWLTPHLLAPPAGPDRAARELHILRSGQFNGGCVGASRCAEAMRFLEWWQSRVYRHSSRSVAKGLFFDQKWLDYAPIFFNRVAIVRDPGCNVAYWNVAERDATASRFFHFSGFDPRRPWISTHEQAPVPEALALRFAQYARLLETEGFHETCELPWTFDRFANGVRIPAFVRELLRDADEDPFGGFHDWLHAPVDDRVPLVTNLWAAVYRARSDVQQAMPYFLENDRTRFVEWTRSSGLREHAIDDVFAI